MKELSIPMTVGGNTTELQLLEIALKHYKQHFESAGMPDCLSVLMCDKWLPVVEQAIKDNEIDNNNLPY